MSQTIRIFTTADAQALTPDVVAALGDAPTIEETAMAALSWLMPPSKPGPVFSAVNKPEPTTDAERRLASSYGNLPAWLVPPRAA